MKYIGMEPGMNKILTDGYSVFSKPFPKAVVNK
jgi:hypothetical protein